ncbi:Rpn family recombination-promoting nuclease/putative transposase [Ammoniphilus sp. CFH 90114]|uniref:Rpn family recombination-promoting nuclease/putative transposase n=1 Tax=Ammoniphilus sp. CFH 90114 TaxID=2493665 RepID=UPI0013E94E15|nr:Rpn family recombination-promoting nuclease/putative transposase [Ammoniphilus sp. CFH 90114]
MNAMLKPPPDRRIMGVTILDTEMGREHEEDRNAFLDIHAELNNGNKVNIEIQVTNEHNMTKRTLYYWSRTYMEGFQKGDPFDKLPRTISIAIIDYILYKKEALHRYHLTFDLMEREESILWDDTMEIHLVEMPKLVRMWRQKRIGFGDDEVIEWLLLLEADEDEGLRKELRGRAMDNPILHEAMEKWEDLSRDPNAIREYEARHKALMDRLAAEAESERRQKMKYEEGLREGLKEGEHQKTVEIVRNMLAMGMEIEAIVQVTGLTIEQVQKHRHDRIG